MKKIVILGLILIVVLGTFLAGCASSSTTTPPTTPTAQSTTPANTSTGTTSATQTPSVQPQYGGTFKIHRVSPPDGAIGDANNMSPQTWESMAYIVFQPLMYVDSTGKLLPCLALSETASSDLTYIDVQLRQGVTFHDGSSFNATVAKWNLDMNAQEVKQKNPQLGTIEVTGPYSIRVHLNYWTNTVYSGLSGQMMRSEVAYETKGKAYSDAHPIGTGPFAFDSYNTDVQMNFKKYDGYWEKGKPYMDGIENIYISDTMTSEIAFEKGDLDLAYLFLPKQDSELAAKGYPYNSLASALCPVHGLVPSNGLPDSPLANLKVRQAISLAINRDAITKALGYGLLTPLHQIAPVGSVAYVPELASQDQYDIAKAKQLLSEAGYPNGFKTRLIIPPNWANQEMANAIQASLADAGIDVSVEYPSQGAFAQYRFTQAGWGDGLVFQEFSNWPTYTMHPYLYWDRQGPLAQYFNNAYPAGEQDLVNKVIGSPTIEPSLCQQLNKMLFDNKTVIPLYELHMEAFYQKGVHTDYLSLGFKNVFRAADTWMDKSIQ